jgi:hypothetical protein
MKSAEAIGRATLQCLAAQAAANRAACDPLKADVRAVLGAASAPQCQEYSHSTCRHD